MLKQLNIRIYVQLALLISLIILVFSILVIVSQNPLGNIFFWEWILFCCFLPGLFLFIGAKYFITHKLMNPIYEILEENNHLNDPFSQSLEMEEPKKINDLAQSLHHSLINLQYKTAKQNQFIYTSLQEIHIPLVYLTEQLDYIQNHGLSPLEMQLNIKKLSASLEEVNKLCTQLRELVQDIKTVDPKSFEKIEVDVLINKTKAELLKKYPKKNIQIQMAAPFSLTNNQFVMGDKYLLEHALYQLLENACKFSNTEKVDVNLKYYSQLLHISIGNFCREMKPEEIKKLNQPFFRGSNADGTKGTGLGLSLAQKIIAQHLGKITIQYKPNNFAEVGLFLPASQA